MDRITAQKLQGINTKAAMKHRHDLVKTEKTFGKLAEQYHEESRKAPTLEGRRKLEGIARQMEASEETTQTINETAAKKIEQEVEGRVNQAIKSGQLPKPDMKDEFVKRHLRG